MIIFSRLPGFITVFYNAVKKVIIEFGSSENYSSHPMLATNHAEDYIINKIQKKCYDSPAKDLKILIWKQNAKGEIRPVFCCQWCKKRILQTKFPIENVITISNEYMHHLYPDNPEYFTKKSIKLDSSDDSYSSDSSEDSLDLKMGSKNKTFIPHRRNVTISAVTEYVYRYPLLKIHNSRRPIVGKGCKPSPMV